MQAVSSREVLIITAAAAGAALTARWCVCRDRRVREAMDAPARDRVEELHRAYRDRTLPSGGSPTSVLYRHWSRLYPLQFAPGSASAAALRRSSRSRSKQ
ncbi:hypothetical protein [Streptomyces sp. NPDC058739]|uniref:hypothetical protein n=1 Tax=Streptomyces sp. NPDC058739 TaxID=3346618 RepID=UPI003687F451